MSRLPSRRGSSLIEFAFVLPVGVALLAAALSMAMVSLRAIQAGQFARDAVLLADSGVDLGSADGRRRLAELGRELGIDSGKAAVVISRIVREPGGLRVDAAYRLGDTDKLGLPSAPKPPRMETEGESAWVVEVAAESGAFAPMLPEVVRARNVL